MQRFIMIIFMSMMVYSLSYAKKPVTYSDSPCYESIKTLEDAYYSKEDTSFKKLLDSAFENMQPLPSEYQKGNPWTGKHLPDLTVFLNDWCTFLPTIDGSHDTGLKYIENFVWFYYHNPDGVKFVQQSPGREIMQNFAKQRGAFMDSKASAVQINNWLKDVRTEKEDYILPKPHAADGGFESFNEFFARTLKDQHKSRPQTMPERDYVISAPTDCIINSIPQTIGVNTLIPTKGRQALNISDMLGGSKYANKFIGGTALSCVLMPNTYHHYHAPVSGNVVEAKIIEDAYYGYDDFPNWAPQSGNVGYYGTNFSQFENFKRGYFIVDTGNYGHVALIPVGLNTISSIVFEKQFAKLTDPVPVKRGDSLGHFLYGGSLFLMVFEPNRYKSDAIKVRLGNQIGIFDTKVQKHNAATQLKTFVERAAVLIEQKGEKAFDAFRQKGSEWFKGDRYAFVWDMKGLRYVYPADIKGEGEQVRGLKDVDDKPIGELFIEVASSKEGKGWVHYRWPKPGETAPSWKSTYVMKVKSPSGKAFLIGSGAYDMPVQKSFVVDVVDSAVELLLREGSKAFDMIKDKRSQYLYQDTYVFVIEDNGLTLLNAAFPKLEGRNIIDYKDADGNYFVQEFINVAKNRGHGWVDYPWPKPGDVEKSQKLTYVRKVMVNGKMVVVCAGLYQD